MKPSLPKGTRDFGSAILRKRNFITDTIRACFLLYGFDPLETPAMEYTSTLMGKYGQEGDQLIFKVLNNGLNLPEKAEQSRQAFEEVLQGKYHRDITSRALRYDLTIPFARYIAMNQHQITFPFKRYQIQPVWRADRPQRGRYREFYQCDADIAGSDSLLCDAELALLYAEVFERLGIPVDIRINNRKILVGLAEICGLKDRLTTITTIIDKMDKIGLSGVAAELQQNELQEDAMSTILEFLQIKGEPDEVINKLRQLLKNSEEGMEGIIEMEEVISIVKLDNVMNVWPDCSLARGLSYYTGTIYEVKARNVNMGSIGGGGRYNDLTGLFGLKGISGVGISFGLDRIYDAMEELHLFPEKVEEGTRVLFFNMGPAERNYAFRLLQQCRNNGIAAGIYYEAVKIDKQFKYAEKHHIPFVVIAGSREMQEGTCTVKDIRSGIQEKIESAQLNDFLKRKFILPDIKI